MNQAINLYHEGVRFAEQGDMAKVRHQANYKTFYEKAFWLEKEAASLMTAQDRFPFSRFDMMQSAAALAFKAGKFAEAQEMIALCRSENPPEHVAHLLDDLEKRIGEAKKSIAPNGHLTFQGKLVAANADKEEITISDEDGGKSWRLVVPVDILKKTVQTYWLENVSAQVSERPDGVYVLEQISAAA